jgi:hypothetical protein
MRVFVTTAFVTFFIFSSLFAVDPPKSKSVSACLDNIAIDFDNGTLIMTPRSGEKFKVEITDDDELYVNGHKIGTDAYEKELLNEYRNEMIYLVERATEIGFKGAEVGLHAIGGLIEVACTDRELDELEAELESKSDKLDKEAEELEELGARLEDIHQELKYRISELNELNSF